MALTDDEIYALAALVNDPTGRPRFTGAEWVGCCSNGHVILSAAKPYPFKCNEMLTLDAAFKAGVVTRSVTGTGIITCGATYHALPNQEALLAAFRLGGWPALVQAAKAMIPS